ncbi:glycerate kinase [Dactylosporangium siamense]|uniref:Glycerate kinase n=1 Tax=Dactylosporangium siamense TaxID=685454 RepID=A0A919PKI7_9ACTN|nr:glycerate kinase [Dactylosporangium siamense]GIG45212.1 glycerate kinase [Dactylosporangium siamense]
MTGAPNRPTLRAIVAADKFRGFATALSASREIAAGMREVGVDAVPLPVGDGGEETARAVHHVTGGTWVVVDAVNAWGRPVAAQVLQVPNGDTLLEAADVIGLHARPADASPLTLSSAALGQLIRRAAPHVDRRLVVCLGGTATMDGGRGLVEALDGRLPVDRVLVAADVDVGYSDCVRLFARQKGATPAEAAQLSRNARRTGAQLERAAGIDPRVLPFGGAGGGIGGALACLGAELRGGFSVYCALTGFADAVRGADVLIAGEGCADRTTWLGKAPGEVIRLARRGGMIAGLVAGTITAEARQSFADACTTVVALDELAKPGDRWSADAAADELCRVAGRAAARSLITSGSPRGTG